MSAQSQAETQPQSNSIESYLSADLSTRLGEKVQERWKEEDAGTWRALLGVLVMGVGVVGALTGLGIGVLSLIAGSEAVGFGACTAIGGLLFGALLGGGGFWLYRSHEKAGGMKGFGGCENGLAMVKDSDVETIEWDEVTELHRSLDKTHVKGVVEISMPWGLGLVAEDGTDITVQHWPGGRQAGDFIREKAHTVLFDKAVRRIENGGKVDFGSMAVSPQGLHGFGMSTIPWDEVQDIYVDRKNTICVSTGAPGEGILGGERGDGWGYTPSGDVLFSVVRHFLGQASDHAQAPQPMDNPQEQAVEQTY